jgi:hypothetical protein
MIEENILEAAATAFIAELSNEIKTCQPWGHRRNKAYF